MKYTLTLIVVEYFLMICGYEWKSLVTLLQKKSELCSKARIALFREYG